MNFSSRTEPTPSDEFCRFLKQEFGLTEKAIELAVKHSQYESAPIPIILWKFGLISIPQYQQLLDWIENNG